MESGENLSKCDALKPVGLGSLAAVNKNKLVIIASGKSAARVALKMSGSLFDWLVRFKAG